MNGYQIRCLKDIQGNPANIIYRFINNKIYIRSQKDSPQAQQMIQQFRKFPVEVYTIPQWIVIDLFAKESSVKFGEIILLKEDDAPYNAKKLSEYFSEVFKKAQFIIEVKEI